MFALQRTAGCVVNNTHPMGSAHEMNSLLLESGALVTSFIKTFAAGTFPYSRNLYCAVPKQKPATWDANHARRVFDNLPTGAKIQYLTRNAYRPQAGFPLPGLSTLSDHLREKMTDVAVSKIEGLVALYAALSSVSDEAGFLSVLILYAKTHNHASLTGQLTTIVTKLFDNFEPQSSNDKPLWLTKMKEALYNWKLLIGNPAFSQISRVLSLLVTLGVIESKSVTLGNFEIFAVEAEKKHCNAFDLMDAIVDTIMFFAEGGYMCYMTGSLSPLLFSSPKLAQLEEQYIKKLGEWEHARNGNLERFTDITEAQFDKELKALIDEFHQLYKTIPNGVEKKIVQQKWESLSKIFTEFTATRICGGLRMSPLAIKIFGGSGVGKSTFADITMMTVLKAMGLPCTADYICTLNEADRYMSNYRSYITGVKLDDLGNTKKEFWEVSPTETIIKIVNNIREYAVMADLANKGKISIEPACLTITTNVEEIHAGLASYNAMSVLRRCHVHVELKVKPEFMTNNLLDSSKVIQKFGSVAQLNDIWNITIKKPIGSGENCSQFSHYEITHKDISITEYVNYIAACAKKHRQEQQVLVDSFAEPANIVNLCEECNKCVETCECVTVEETPSLADTLETSESESESKEDDDDYTPQFGERLAGHIVRKGAAYKHVMRREQAIFETEAEDFSIRMLLKLLKGFEESPYSNWTSYVPEQWMDNDIIKSTILAYGQDVIGQSVKKYLYRMGAMTLGVSSLVYKVLGARCASVALLGGGLYHLFAMSGIIETKKTAYMDALVKSRETLPECFKTVRDQHVKHACMLFGALGVMYAAAQTYKAVKANLTMQGKLAPKSIDDIRERDLEANVWSVPERIPMSHNGSFVNQEFARNALRTAQFIVEINGHYSEAFYLSSKEFLIPAHLLPSDTEVARFKGVSGNVKMLLEPDAVVRIPNTDFAMVYCHSGVPGKDMLKHFEDDFCKTPMPATLHGISESLTPFSDKLYWSHANDVYNGAEVFPGSFYELGVMKTFAGLCMAPIVSDSTEKKILGFHMGGVEGTRKGCGCAITRPQLLAARAELRAKNKTHLPAPQARDIEDSMMGVEYAKSPYVHSKCPTNFISGDPALVAYGTVTGKSSFSSDVIETPISKIVEEVTGVPNQHGPPKFVDPVEREDGSIDMQRWKPWYKSLEVCSKPSIGFAPSKVERAMDDYTEGLIAAFETLSDVHRAEMKPLTHQETISGIKGKRFIDAMVSKTSVGYPLGGPKSKIMVDLPPTEEHEAPRDFTPEVQAEIAAALSCADANEMMNLIFGASLKDEPTKWDKEKVRVFQAAPLALQYAIRMYFLPIARAMSLHPLVAEMAVGVNAHGPEWNELSEFMAKFGDDRILAGDYSKYDLRMPAQLTLAAFAIMIEFAEWSGNYTAQDIQRMRVIAHEVCTPLVAYNGTLLRFLGTNPSGQNMTVYINSIVNSLLHRICFFEIYNPSELARIGKELGLGRPATYRDLVATMTYGDDARGSVREGFDLFNHISMAEILKANDMIFTMPDKESEPTKYMNRYEADFLKRKDRYEAELGVHVGMLEEASIFKSLHSILKSKACTPEEVCAQNIDGALREWFFHGRETFEMRRKQMKEIASRGNLVCQTLDEDYDFRIDAWKKKYKYTTQSGTISDDDSGFDLETVEWSTDEDISEVTETIPVDTEEELMARVKKDLGKPTAEEYIVISRCLGIGDLLYFTEDIALVIECKRVLGRPSRYKKEVREQAMKYAAVIGTLRPDITVYAITYTELGYNIVDCLGFPRFPARFAEFLDSIPISYP
ncbi:hypothetical protein 1 [Wenzhou picorna-like virus 1]|uniref:hypothetical protein 1 n=1 Tax=Wenzhou picorna-like virus 1 TaxID=1923593 RepID=UPI00090969AD|nr:hypothetical protein 1 [Wenzhou picorna-like virus 1]APG78572.1 hypothetical protein 1 [Wenzhou picorna-like virus 1]